MGVYAIQCTGSKHVKIGFTQFNVESRLKQLQTGSPFELEVLEFVPEADMSFEKLIHRKFKPFRVRGEWFSNLPKDFCLSDLYRLHKNGDLVVLIIDGILASPVFVV